MSMIAQIKPQTKEDIDRRTRIHKMYDYYGIPYGVFDESKDISVPMEKDWNEAIILISEDKVIPKDLEERLLQYKLRLTQPNDADKQKKGNE